LSKIKTGHLMRISYQTENAKQSVVMNLKPLSLAVIILYTIFGVACSSPEQATRAVQADIDMSYQEVPMPDQLITEEFPRPDVWAKYPGGQQLLSRTIQLSTRIPEQARRDGYGGRAIITYVVDENGVAGQAEALMSPHESITEMYRSIVENLNQWQPAILDGEPVAQQYIIVSTFRDGNVETDN
jgi:hypothetical protein